MICAMLYNDRNHQYSQYNIHFAQLRYCLTTFAGRVKILSNIEYFLPKWRFFNQNCKKFKNLTFCGLRPRHDHMDDIGLRNAGICKETSNENKKCIHIAEKEAL